MNTSAVQPAAESRNVPEPASPAAPNHHHPRSDPPSPLSQPLPPSPPPPSPPPSPPVSKTKISEDVVKDRIPFLPNTEHLSATLPFIDEACFDATCSVQKIADIFASAIPEHVELFAPEISVLGKHCYSAFTDLVLPALCNALDAYSITLQVDVGTELLAVDMSGLQPASAKLLAVTAVDVLETCQAVNSTLQATLQSVYGDILHAIIPKASWASDEYKVLLRFFDRFSNSGYPEHRMMAHKVLAGISLIEVDPQRYKSLVVSRVLNTLPDSEDLVTASALKSLSHVFSRTPNSVVFDRLWWQILQIWDSDLEANALGRAEAVSAAAEIISQRKQERVVARQNEAAWTSFYRSICRFAIEVSTKDLLFVPEPQCRVLLEIATAFGILTLYSFKPLDVRTMRVGIDAFTALSTCNDASIRQKCAFNLPGVSLAFGLRHKPTLLRILQLLATDEADNVRQTIAKGFHETFRFLANRRNVVHLLEIFDTILRDELAEVRVPALQNCSAVLAVLRQCNQELSCDHLVDSFLVPTIVDSDWRTGEKLVQNITSAAGFLSASWKEDELIPLLIQVFRKGAPPVRRAAGHGIVTMLRSLPGLQNRRNVAHEFCAKQRLESYALRMALVETLLDAINVFSHRSYRELFANQLFELSRDPVPSIRMRIAADIHRLAPACQVVPAFFEAIEAMARDEDVGVRAAMIGFIQRASSCVQDAKENEEEDKKKLEFEMFGWEDGLNRTALKANPVMSSGIGSQLAKLLPRRRQVRKRAQRGRMRFSNSQTTLPGSDMLPDSEAGDDMLSGFDDDGFQTGSKADLGELFESGNQITSSIQSPRFLALVEFFSDEPENDLSCSLITPDATKPAAGDNGNAPWSDDQVATELDPLDSTAVANDGPSELLLTEKTRQSLSFALAREEDVDRRQSDVTLGSTGTPDGRPKPRLQRSSSRLPPSIARLLKFTGRRRNGSPAEARNLS